MTISPDYDVSLTGPGCAKTIKFKKLAHREILSGVIKAPRGIDPTADKSSLPKYCDPKYGNPGGDF